MGQEIFYCSQCQDQLRSADFVKGGALRLGTRTCCVKCAPKLLATLSPEEQQHFFKEAAKLKGAPPPHAPPARYGKGTDRFPLVAAPPRPAAVSGGSNRLVVGLAAGGVALLLAIGFFALSGPTARPSNSPIEASRTPVPPPPVPAPESEGPREKAARESLRLALLSADAHPEDLSAQIRLLEEAAAQAKGTRVEAETSQALEAARRRIRETVAKELSALDEKVQSACTREEFKKALDFIEVARKKALSSEWSGEMDSREREVEGRAGSAFGIFKEQALEAQQRGASANAKAIVDRVARWGLPELTVEVERVLGEARQKAAVARPPNPLSKEAEAYQDRWREAMTLASARDYALAIKVLADAVTSVKEPKLSEDGNADLRMLNQTATLVREAYAVLSRLPKGQPVSLEFWNEQGSPEKAAGPLLRTDPGWLVLGKEGEVRFVEPGELTAESLVEIWKTQSEQERKLGAAAGVPFLLLLEGGVEPPEKFSALERLLAYAKGLSRGSAILGGNVRDAEARRLFYALERDYGVFARTAEAVEGFKSLLNSHSDTSFVRRNRASLEDRAAGGKEFFLFAGDLQSAGSFERAKNEKVDACITLAADLDATQVKGSFVDVAFSALANTEYRCWVQVGACCAETFQFSFQVTDLKEPHPKRASETVSLEPGSDFSMPAKNSIGGLKKTHALHGGPKQPSRWEWVALPLPQFPQGGPKTVRLFSEHKGFSVACACVSALRQAPPRDTELKEFRRIRPSPTSRAAAKAAAGKILFSENFEKGPGQFKGGEIVDGGVNGSKAYAFSPQAVEVWNGWSMPARESVTVSFKVKALADVELLTFMVWSPTLKDNGRYYIRNLRKGEWREVRFTLQDIRIGWQKNSPPIDVFGNMKLFSPDAPANLRILLDDFEIRG